MSYYTGFSENYENYLKQQRSLEYQEQLENSKSPYSFKDYKTRTEGIGNLVASNKVNYLDYVFNSVSTEQLRDFHEAAQENMFSPFRYDPEEHNLRITARKKQAEENAIRWKQIDEDPTMKIWAEGMTLGPLLEKAMTDPENAWYYLPDSDSYQEESMGSFGSRIFDLTTMYEGSKAANNYNAPIMASLLGDAGNVAGAKARSMLIHFDDKSLFDLMTKAVNLDPNNPITTDELFRQEDIDRIVTRIGDSPDDWAIWEMFQDALVDFGEQGESTIWESFGTRQGEWDSVVNGIDENWAGDEKKGIPGQRDAIANAIENLETDDVLLLDYLRNNPNLADDIRRSSNPLVLVKTLNKRRTDLVLGEYMTRSDGRFGFTGTMNMIGYGFRSDPTIGIELAATVGAVLPAKLALKGIQLSARLVDKFTDVGETARNYNRAQKAKLALNNRAKWVQDWATKLDEHGVNLATRFLPGRILSELVFPSVQTLGRSAKAKSFKGMYSWVKENKYLPESTKGKLVYRAVSGGMEGALWGSAEYSYMAHYEDSMNTMMFGEDAARMLAHEREQSGAFGLMVAMGAGLGSVMSPTLGLAFDQTGSAVGGIANIVGQKYVSMASNPKSWVSTKFNPILLKGLKAAQKVGNLFTPADVDYRTAMVGQAMLKYIDPDGVDPDFVAPRRAAGDEGQQRENLMWLTTNLVSLNKIANKAGVNLLKVAKAMMKDLPVDADNRLSVYEIYSKLARQMTDTIEDREKRGAAISQQLIDSRNTMQEQMGTRGNLMPKIAETMEELGAQEAALDAAPAPTPTPEPQARGGRNSRRRRKREQQRAERDRQRAEQRQQEAEELADSSKPPEVIELEEKIKRLNDEADEADQKYRKAQEEGNTDEAEKAALDKQQLLTEANNYSLLAAHYNVEGSAKAVAEYRARLLNDAFNRSTPDDLGNIGIFKALDELDAGAEINYAWIKMFFPEQWIQRMKENASDEEMVTALNNIEKGSLEVIRPDDVRRIIETMQKDNYALLAGLDISLADMEYVANYTRTKDKDLAYEKAKVVARYEELEKMNIITEEDVRIRTLSPEELVELSKNKQEVSEKMAALRTRFQEEGALDLVLDDLSSASLKAIARQFNETLPRRKRKENGIKISLPKGELLAEIKTKLGQRTDSDSLIIEQRIAAYFDDNYDVAVQKEILGLLNDEAELEKSKILGNERSRQRRNNVRYQAAKRKWKEANKDFIEEKNKTSEKERINYPKLRRLEGRKNAAWDVYKESITSLEKSLEAQWETRIKPEAVQRKAGRISIENRPNVGHLNPLIRLSQYVSSYMMFNKQRYVRSDGYLDYDLSMSRAELISILNQEPGYVVLMHAIEAEFGVQNNYDAKDILGVIFTKISKSNNALGDTLRNNFERLLKNRYETAHPGSSDVYTGMFGQLTNLLNSNAQQQEGRVSYALSKRRGDFFAGEDGSNISESAWREAFSTRLMEGVRYQLERSPDSPSSQRLKAILEDVDTGNPEAVQAALLKELQKANPVINDFADLGSTLDWVGPNRAALGVVQALTSRRATSSRIQSSEIIVGESKGGRRNEIRRELGATNKDRIGIQEYPDSTYIKDKQEFDATARAEHILSAENNSDDMAKLKAWIEGFSEADLEEMRSTGSRDMGLAVLPTFGIHRATDVLPMGLEETINNNVRMMTEISPSFMLTIHDALYAQYPTMFTGQGAQQNPRAFFNWNKMMETDDGQPFRGLGGLGWGFGTMMARGGSIEDLINVGTAITFGYDNLINFARANFKKFAQEEIDKLGLSKEELDGFDEDDSLAWLYKNWETLDEDTRTKLQGRLFPEIEYDDANASGSNIILALYGNYLGSEQIKEFFKQAISKQEKFDPKGVVSETFDTTYTLVEKFVRDQFTGENLENIKGSHGRPDAEVTALENLGKIFNFFGAEENAQAFKDLLKRPVMTDLYWAGRQSMADAIYKEFFMNNEYSQKIIGNQIFAKADYNEQAREASWMLAGLLNDNGDTAVNGWIKENVFGPGSKVENKDLADMLKNRVPISIVEGKEKFSLDARLRSEGARQAAGAEIVGDPTLKPGGGSVFGDRAGPGGSLDHMESMRMLLAEAIGRIQVLTDAGNSSSQAKDIVKNQLKDIFDVITKDEALNKRMNDGEWEKADLRYSELINQHRADNERITGFNRYARQGFQFKEEDFREVLSMMFTLEPEVVDSVLADLSPMAKRAMNTSFYRTLGMDNAGRMYSNSMNDPIQIKALRPFNKDESPLGVLKFFEEEEQYIKRKNIEKLTILDTALKLSEITGDLPELNSGTYRDPEWDAFYSRYEEDSNTASILREAAKESLKKFELLTDEDLLKIARKFEDPNNPASMRLPENMSQAKEFATQMKKMLVRVMDSTGEARDSELANFASTIVGSESPVQTARLPGVLGFLPKTYQHDFANSPIPFLRGAQLELDNDVKTYRKLQNLANMPRARETEAVFSPQEFEWSLGRGDTDVVPPEVLLRHTESLRNTFTMSLTSSPDMISATEMVRADLTNFGRKMGVSGLNVKPVHEFLLNKEWDKLLLTKQALLAKREAHKGQKAIEAAAGKLRNIESRLKQQYPELDEAALQIKAENNPRWIKAKRNLDRTIDTASIMQEQVMRTLVQWGWDAKNKETDLLSFQGENLDSIYSGKTMEEALGRLAEDNVSTGNFVAWLAGDAKQFGEIIAGDGEYAANAGYGVLANVAQAMDSTVLYLLSYAQAYTQRYAIQKLLNKEVVTSVDVQNFTKWWDAVLRNKTDEVPELKNIYEGIPIENVQKALDEGAIEARVKFSNDHTLADVLQNNELIQIMKQKVDDEFSSPPSGKSNLQQKLENSNVNVSIEDLMARKGKYIDDKKILAVFVTPFGQALEPNKVLGEVFVRLTSNQKTTAINYIGNLRVTDRIRLANTLNINKLPMNHDLASNISGYDPFTSFGTTIVEARNNAALVSSAVRNLAKENGREGRLNLITDNRYTVRDGSTVSRAEFLQFSNYDIEEAFKAADAILAKEIEKGLAEKDSELGLTTLPIMRIEWANKGDESYFNEAINLVPFISNSDRGFNVFYRQHVLRRQLLDDRNNLNKETANKIYTEKIEPILKEIHSSLNRKAENDIEEVDLSFYENRSIMDPELEITEAELLRTLAEMDNSISFINETVYPDTALARSSNAAKREIKLQAIEDKISDSNDPMSGINNIYNRALSERQFNQMGKAYRNFNGLLAYLADDNVITPNDVYLLRATFYHDGDTLKRLFESSDFTDRVTITTPGDGSVYKHIRQGEQIAERIYFANNLAKDITDGTPLTAVGVILEELGHSLGAKLSARDRQRYFLAAKELLKTDSNVEIFTQLENIVFGKYENRAASGARQKEINDGIINIRTNEDPEYINKVTEQELFGVLFALSMLEKNGGGLDSLENAAVYKELMQDSGHFVGRLRAYQNVLSNFADSDQQLFKNITQVTENLQSNFKPYIEMDGPDVVSRLHNRAGERDIESDRNLESEEARMESDLDESIVREELDLDYIQRVTDSVTDRETGIVDTSLIKNPELRRQVEWFKAEEVLETMGAGLRWDTPVANTISAITFGLIAKNRMSSFIENVAAPFAARKFAYATNGKNHLSAIMSGLLHSLDSSMLVHSGAFSKAMPTLEGLRLQLEGTFEPLITAVEQIRAANSTNLTDRENPYTLFSLALKEVILNREPAGIGEDGRITRGTKPRGWQGEERAREIAMSELTKVKGYEDTLSPDGQEVEALVKIAKMWSDPKEGIWKQILQAMQDSGTIDERLADKLLTEGVYPIKFADSVFGNEEHNSVAGRESLRTAISEQIRLNIKESYDVLNEDVFRVAFADLFVGTIDSRKTALRKSSFREFLESQYVGEDFTTGLERLVHDIRAGKVNTTELLNTPEARQKYYSMLEKGKNAYSPDDSADNLQRQAMDMIIQEIRDSSSKSQRRAFTSLHPGPVSDIVAMRYMARMGTSAYTFTGDTFLSPAAMLDNDAIATYIEIDPVAIFDSIRRGVAAQAFDKQLYGNFFKVKGMGMGRVMEMLEPIAENRDDAPYTLMLGKDFQRGAKRTLDKDEVKKFKYALNHMQDAYRYAIGTLSPVENDGTSLPLINMMVKAGQLGSALSVGPRLAMAALIEETPMSVLASLKTNLTTMNDNLAKTFMLAKKKGDILEYLEGLGFIAHEMRHQANTMMRQTGDLVTGTQPGNLVKRIYKFTSMGLNKQMNASRAQGVRMLIANLDEMFDSYKGFTSIDGVEIFDKHHKLNPTFDAIALAFRNQGDPTTITREKFRTITKDLGLSEELKLHVSDMLKLGLFNEELAPIFKDMYLSNREQIHRKSFPFDDIRHSITFGSSTPKERANKLQVLNSIAELAYTNATRYAKESTLSNQPFGARNLGPFAPLVTMLTTYASNVYATMRRLMSKSSSLALGAFMAHSMSGYLYYKLVQLQMSKSLDDIIRDLKKDPMGELQEAMMSVPFLGMNQMAIATLLQVLRGERPANTQIFNIAGLSMVNRILQLPKRLMNAVDSINTGEPMSGAANVASQVPLPYFALVPIGLRSADSDMLKYLNGESQTRSRKQIEGASSSVLNPKGEVATSTSKVKPSTDVISQIEGVSQKETPSEIIDMIDKN